MRFCSCSPGVWQTRLSTCGKPYQNSKLSAAFERVAGFPGESRDLCVSVLRSPLEHLLKTGPAGIVILLQFRRFQRKAGRPNNQARLEHEGERVGDLLRLQFGRD